MAGTIAAGSGRRHSASTAASPGARRSRSPQLRFCRERHSRSGRSGAPAGPRNPTPAQRLRPVREGRTDRLSPGDQERESSGKGVSFLRRQAWGNGPRPGSPKSKHPLSNDPFIYGKEMQVLLVFRDREKASWSRAGLCKGHGARTPRLLSWRLEGTPEGASAFGGPRSINRRGKSDSSFTKLPSARDQAMT